MTLIEQLRDQINGYIARNTRTPGVLRVPNGFRHALEAEMRLLAKYTTTEKGVWLSGVPIVYWRGHTFECDREMTGFEKSQWETDNGQIKKPAMPD